MTPQPQKFSYLELAQCARREAAYRRRVYPRWIEAGKLNPAIAAREIALMAAMQSHFEQLDQPNLL